MNLAQTDTPEVQQKVAIDKTVIKVRQFHVKQKLNWGRTISIRFDNTSLQLVTIKKSIKSVHLIDITKTYIPKTYNTLDRQKEFISIEISRYVKQFGTKYTNYILGISGRETVQRIIGLPFLSKNEMDTAVYWEGNKSIPFELKNSYYGYHLFETKETESDTTASISLMAVAREVVDEKIKLLEELDINIKAIYHELEAVGRLLPQIDDYDSQKSYALINIKQTSSEISFYKGDCLKFMNISSVGTSALSDTPNNDKKFEFFTETLVDEIANTLDYYVGQFAKTATDQVFVYGDLSYSDDLISNLTNRFGIEFRKFPVENIEEEQKVSERFNTDLSVSLTGVALAYNNYDLINFLPPKNIEQNKIYDFKRMSVAGIALLIVVLFGVWFTMGNSNKIIGNEVNLANKQIDNIQNSPTIALYNQIKNRMAAEQAIVNGLHHEPTYLNLNLKELSRITPDEILLMTYNLRKIEGKNELTLSGQVASSETPPEVILAEFIARLESSAFYDEISLNKHIKQFDKGSFTIDFVVSARAIL